MRRSTAAAVGTLTGVALIMGVRLSVTPQPLAAAPPSFDDVSATGQGAAGGTPKPSPSRSKAGASDEEGASASDEDDSAAGSGDDDAASASGLKDGRFTGKPVTNPYGQVQVAITVAEGRITAAAVSAPTDGNSGTVNGNAVPKLKEATLQAQSAEIDAVSGATYTSQGYVESLQAALDAARG